MPKKIQQSNPKAQQQAKGGERRRRGRERKKCIKTPTNVTIMQCDQGRKETYATNMKHVYEERRKEKKRKKGELAPNNSDLISRLHVPFYSPVDAVLMCVSRIFSNTPTPTV